MKKLTKTAVVVASMAVMAMGATVMAGAATEGWVQSGSNWYYYVNGDKVSDQWVLAGENWYFVDEEGRMVKNTFVRIDKYDGSSEVLDDSDIHASLGKDDIDDDSEFYYMNADGTMHKGWKEFKASNIYASPNSDVASKLWYYFGASGRMYVNEWVESSGEWYALSNNGQMYAEAVVNNDLVDWDADNNYYMDKNGAWVKGWYKTTKTKAGSAPDVALSGKIADKDQDQDWPKEVFFDKNKPVQWVYGDPETGVLAEKEWKEINGKYYFFGIQANSTINAKDDKLLIRTVLDGNRGGTPELTSGDVLYQEGFVVTGSAGTVNKVDDISDKVESAIQKAAMYSDVFVYWTNHGGSSEYFYLKKDGDALTSWKELEDDYWICGNSKGELYWDEVALINGKYYYFDRNGICDEKSLNNTVDYIAVVGDNYKDGKQIISNDFGQKMYETTSATNKYDDVYGNEKWDITRMKDDLANGGDQAKAYYKIDNRKVSVKSMTDNEVILAFTAKNFSDSTRTDAFNTEITVYKLRTSGKLTGTVSK